MFTPSWASLDLLAELAEMKEIMARSRKCRQLQDSEPGWNEQVHCRVLELALKDQPAVGFQNMYSTLCHFSVSGPLVIIDQPRYFNRFTVSDNKSDNEQYDSKNFSARIAYQERQRK